MIIKILKFLSKHIFFLCITLLFLIPIKVEAATVTGFCTRFHYVNKTSSSAWTANTTDFKCSNSAVMNGSGVAQSYPFQFTTGFYIQMPVNLSANMNYTFSINMTYQNLMFPNEFNGETVKRIADSTFWHSSTGTIQSVSMQYNSVGACTNSSNCSVNIIATYTLRTSSSASTLYLGSYSTSNYNFGFEAHVQDVTISINSINVVNNADDTIINQNQTIINQNQTQIEQNNQTNEKLDGLKDSQDKTNDLLEDDDTDEATNTAGDFFSGFESDTFGLTSIITAPLAIIQSITSSSCNELGLPLPYVNKNLTLPCMGTIYQNTFGNFLTVYQTITFGIVAYWICVRIFNKVKDFKNPEKDEIEVLEL